VKWPSVKGPYEPGDWFLTPEIFSEADRPGFAAFMAGRPCRFAAVYHDAIPMKHPSITWPASVRRHPAYLALLSRFDRVWAVSRASREELLGFWRWQGVANPPPVDVLTLGADGAGFPRPAEPTKLTRSRRIVSVGIIEPRKNQSVLLDAFASLRSEGVEWELHLAGRVNPHFGRPIMDRVSKLAQRWPGLVHHPALDDRGLSELIASARATAFPSIAEGCGLPLLESLWLGIPCVCSDIAPVLENAAGGGCEVVAGNSPAGWAVELRRILDRSPPGRPPLLGSARPYSLFAAKAIAAPIFSSCSSVCIADTAVRMRSLPVGTAGEVAITVKMPFSRSACQKG
jgi:glycosyltransferase involved in cell wall biosynthesis